jgi:preprotein translocase subunit SecE
LSRRSLQESGGSTIGEETNRQKFFDLDVMVSDAKSAPSAKLVKAPRVSVGEFVRQVRAETSKIKWPSRRETVTTTILVLIMTSLLSIFFLGVDQLLGAIVKFLLGLAG